MLLSPHSSIPSPTGKAKYTKRLCPTKGREVEIRVSPKGDRTAVETQEVSIESDTPPGPTPSWPSCERRSLQVYALARRAKFLQPIDTFPVSATWLVQLLSTVKRG